MFTIFLIFSVILLSIVCLVICFFFITQRCYNFFISSLIAILFGVDFIGILFILVYVGAVAVLFLFVIMMLELKFEFIVSNNFFLFLGFLFFLFFYLIFRFLIELYLGIDFSIKKIEELSFSYIFFSIKQSLKIALDLTKWILLLFFLFYVINLDLSRLRFNINPLIFCEDNGELMGVAAGTITSLGYVLGGGLVIGAGLCGLGVVGGVYLLIRNRAIFFDSLHPKGIVQTGLAKEKADPSLVPPVNIQREDWKRTTTIPEHFETAEDAALNPDTGPGSFWEKFCRFLSYNFPEGDAAWEFFLKNLNYSSGWYSNFDEFIPWLDAQFINLGTYGFYQYYWYWIWGGSIGLPLTFGLVVQLALKCLWHYKVWGFFYTPFFISCSPLLTFSYSNFKFLEL